MRQRQTDRRALERARRTPDEAGVRAGVGEAFGFGDPRAWADSVERFWWTSRRWLTRRPA